MQLTTCGRLYHGDLAKVFALIDSELEKLDRARVKGGIPVDTPRSLATKWIGPRLDDWQMRHPAAHIRLVGSDSEPQFGDSIIDCRITYLRRIIGYSHFIELFTYTVVPACSPEFFAELNIGNTEDLQRLPLFVIE